MHCLTGASNVLFHFFTSSPFFPRNGKIHYPHSRIILPQLLSQPESQGMCIIKQQLGSPTVATQELAQQQCFSWSVSHTEEWFHVVHCGRWGFEKWWGWPTIQSNVKGRSWSTLKPPHPPPHSNTAAISHSHMASAEQSGRLACGRESSPCNLYLHSNANFQFNTLGKQQCAHTEDGGQEPLECDVSRITVDSGMSMQV